MFTVDTNILISYAGGDERITEFFLENLKSNILYLPTVVVVEFFGFAGLTEHERRIFVELLPQLEIVPLDFELSLKAADLRKSHNMKLGDSVVAATALEKESALVTRNVSDFRKVPNLKLLKI